MLVPSNLTTLATFVGKPERKRTLGRPERKRNNETEMPEDMGRILVPWKSQLVYFVNTWKNIRVP